MEELQGGYLGIIEEFIELFIIFRFRIFISETAKRVILRDK